MKTIFLASLSLLFSVSYAQQSQTFKVITKNTNEPVAYAMVKVLHQEKGTLTTFSGEFSLDDSYKDTDTLKISCLGYSDYFTTVNNIKINSIIELKQKTTDLDEVVITAKKGGFKTKKLGVDTKERIHSPKYGGNKIGDEEATWIYNKYSTKGIIKNIKIFVSEHGYPDAYFRIHVYQCNSTTKKPGIELTQSNILARGTTGNEWVTIDIEKENIPIDKNGCFIGVEWLDHPSAKQFKDTVTAHYIGTNKTKTKINTRNGVVFGQVRKTWGEGKNRCWKKIKDTLWEEQFSWEWQIGKPFLHPTTGKANKDINGDTIFSNNSNLFIWIPAIKLEVNYDKQALKTNYKEPKKKYFKNIYSKEDVIEAKKTVKLNTIKYPQASITELLNSGIKAINNNDIVYVHQHLMFYDSKAELESVSNKMKDNLEKHGTVMSEENKKNALNYFQYVIDHMEENELIEQEDGRSFILNIDNRTYTFATINGRWKIHASFVTSVNQSNTIQYQLKK